MEDFCFFFFFSTFIHLDKIMPSSILGYSRFSMILCYYSTPHSGSYNIFQYSTPNMVFSHPFLDTTKAGPVLDPQNCDAQSVRLLHPLVLSTTEPVQTSSYPDQSTWCFTSKRISKTVSLLPLRDVKWCTCTHKSKHFSRSLRFPSCANRHFWYTHPCMCMQGPPSQMVPMAFRDTYTRSDHCL